MIHQEADYIVTESLIKGGNYESLITTNIEVCFGYFPESDTFTQYFIVFDYQQKLKMTTPDGLSINEPFSSICRALTLSIIKCGEIITLIQPRGGLSIIHLTVFLGRYHYLTTEPFSLRGKR